MQIEQERIRYRGEWQERKRNTTESHFINLDYEELEDASFRVSGRETKRGLEWQESPSIKMKKQKEEKK